MNDRHRTTKRIAFRLAKKRTSESDWEITRIVMRFHYEVLECNVNLLKNGLLPIGSSAHTLSLGGYTW